MQNHLEISSKSVLDPKRAKLVQMSLRKVDGNLTESPRPVQEDPYGPTWAHMGPYGPTWTHIWAHKAPYGPIYGPIWAPTRTGPGGVEAPTTVGVTDGGVPPQLSADAEEEQHV